MRDLGASSGDEVDDSDPASLSSDPEAASTCGLGAKLSVFGFPHFSMQGLGASVATV
jgi:hypothetical protein